MHAHAGQIDAKVDRAVNGLILLLGVLAPAALSGTVPRFNPPGIHWSTPECAALGILCAAGYLFGRRTGRSAGMFLFGCVAALGFVPVLVLDTYDQLALRPGGAAGVEFAMKPDTAWRSVAALAVVIPLCGVLTTLAASAGLVCAPVPMPPRRDWPRT